MQKMAMLILGAIVTGFIATIWSMFTELANLRADVMVNKSRIQGYHEDIKEIKSDVKYIIKKIR